MILAGHQTMMANAAVVAPTTFNYFAIKPIATRSLHNYASLSSWAAITNDRQIQLSEFRFINADGQRYSFPSDMTYATFSKYNSARRYQEPVLVSTINSSERWGRIFDNSTSTKVCNSKPQLSTLGVLYDYDSGAVVYTPGQSMTRALWLEKFGCDNVLSPAALVLNVSSSPLDISVYSRWQFLNANDNANGSATTSRTWIEGEILGSNDMTTWWRLDVFNDATIPNTNYAVAYTGNLKARAGDIWSDLDLTTRDWTNGISVDNI